MKRTLLILFLSVMPMLNASAFPTKPDVEGPVNDYAGLLDDGQLLSLRHMLVDFADSTSNQICVVTVNDLEGYSVSEYAIKLGLEWHIGSSDFNNGIVFLIKVSDPSSSESHGEAFIAVGRGLEGAVPDAYCYRIINDTAIPYFAEGDYFGGIRAACLELMRLADSEYHSPYDDTVGQDVADIFIALFILALIVVVLLILAKGSGKGGGNGGGLRRSGPVFFPGMGSFGSSRHSGGGFSGGFSGGFGGGSFGGGGAGGRW